MVGSIYQEDGLDKGGRGEVAPFGQDIPIIVAYDCTDCWPYTDVVCGEV